MLGATVPVAMVINRESNFSSGYKLGWENHQTSCPINNQDLGSGPNTPPNLSGSIPGMNIPLHNIHTYVIRITLYL